MKKLLLIGVAVATMGAGQPAAQQISASDKATGAKAHPQLLAEFGGAYEGPQSKYVERVGQKIALQSGLSNAAGDFKITLLNSSVNNAFAVPGGYVYVTRQLLALMNDEAELASVMGHEVGHVAARHAQKRNRRATIGGLGAVLATVAGAAIGGDAGAKLGQQLGGSLAQSFVLKYSREQEYEADDLGVSYLGRGGFDPLAASTMLKSLADETTLDAKVAGKGGQSLPEWASTHPDPASRVTRAAQKANATVASGKARNRDAFLAAIDGMTYDDDPKQGVIDGTSFRHPDLQLAFTAPTGFAMANGTQAVTIQGSQGQAQFSGAAYNGDLRGYVDSVFKAVGGQTPVNYGTISSTQVNGLNAAYASATANAKSGPVAVTVYAYEFSPTSAFHFVAITPTANAGAFGGLFQSMRRLNANEAAAIKPRIVRVVTVRSGDTVASLSSRMAYTNYQAERFSALNAIPAGGSVKAGQKVKLIVYAQ
jgi:predicted Zn-dependent protease